MKTIRSKDMPERVGTFKGASTFVAVRSWAGERYVGRTGEGKILYNEEGTLQLEIEGGPGKNLPAGHIAFIPPSCGFTLYTERETSLCLLRISVKLHFTESSLPLELLHDVSPAGDDALITLEAHPRIASFFGTMAGYLEDGLSAHLLYTQKARELLLLMRSYYTRELLAAFFRPIIHPHNEFSQFVIANYRNFRTSKQLAEASCHSLSTFNKLFNSTFGQSPYSWMKEQKANDLYYDLTLTDKPIKQISSEHGFGSLSQFTNFCKSHFGVSPRRLRELHHEKMTAPADK